MKRLVSSDSHLRQILDAVANGVTVQDPSGKLVFVNRAAARMMGCASPEEALEKGALAILQKFQFFTEQGRPLDLRQLPGRRSLEGFEEPEMVVGYTSPDFSGPRWTAIKALPVKDADGQVILAVNVLQDITKLREAERRLREANDRITKLLEETLEL